MRSSEMADRSDRIQPHQLQVRPQYGGKGLVHGQVRGVGVPSIPKVLATVASVPVCGGLLMLAGFTLLGTLVGAAITMPLLVLFSPILVPAAIAIGLAVTGFLTSGAFGLTALSALSWVISSIRQRTGSFPDQMDHAKRRMQDMTDYVGQKTKDVGQTIQSKAHEGTGGGRTTDVKS